jgi:hypothetical protein
MEIGNLKIFKFVIYRTYCYVNSRFYYTATAQCTYFKSNAKMLKITGGENNRETF